MQRRLRLRNSRDFQRLRGEGKTWTHPLLVLSVAPNSLDHNRYGIITTRKIGGAVARNRVKRRFRAAAHTLHPRIASGYDVIVIARPRALDCPFADLVRALEDLFRRAGLM